LPQWSWRGRERRPRRGEGSARSGPAIKRVADRLGNTPAVCRSSYIDPRVLDRFRDGKTIELPNLTSEGTVTPRQQSRVERQVLELIE
jgi:DNA topoisomerase I